LPPGTISLRVPDVAEAKAKLEVAGVQVNEMWDWEDRALTDATVNGTNYTDAYSMRGVVRAIQFSQASSAHIHRHY
jgi:hypothetical protein